MKKSLFTKSILFLLSATLLMACATAAERAARQTETANAVRAALADRHYRLTITQAYPRRGGSVNVSRDFFLEVKGDTLVSYLPFFGQAYRSSLSGADKGLNFTEQIRSYEVVQQKDGVSRIRLRVRNEEDSYVYLLDLSDTGRASIRVLPTERDDISFDGDFDF